ncbi:MAG TPA: AAA family ATPase, partial [Gaiellaceae bacterium]
GLDQASEQDADCAAHAALALISAVTRYSAEAARVWGVTDLNVRVGLNTGDAAVSALGSAERANVALGDTTNVAARLQALAEPGTIAIGDETADELRGRFLVEPLGEVHVRGRQAAVRAWRLLGALERPSTPERRRLLGRDPEVALLRSVIDDVCAGQGRLLFVVGDLGIGKTRLLAELEGLVGQRAVLLEAFCAASPAPPPYGPFAALLRAWLGTEPGESGTALRAKLQLRLESLGGSASEMADGLARLLSLDEEDDDRDAIDPGEAYAAWVEALAARRPLVIALDDVHWLEPSSAHLALTLAELAMRLPLLFVSTLRPDHQSHGWRIRTSARVAHPSRARELNLEPLSDEQARELLGELAPDVDPATSEDIVRRAEGNPLFVEQLFRAFREGASFPLGSSSVRTVATAQLLPPALASVFVGRIDRLPPEVRKVTQTAAAIGRTFPKDLLIRLVDREIVETAVSALLNAGIVAERHPHPDQSWSFAHALLRDAALSTLVRSRRRELFSRVAAAFEASVGDAGDEHVELLAYYYARSDDLAKALYYHEHAAEKAFRVGADTEASGHLRLAAQFAEQLADHEAAKRIAARLGH